MVGCFRLLFLLCVSVYVVYFSLGLWVLWLNVRLLVIRFLVWLFLWVMPVLVGLLVLRLFNCWCGFWFKLVLCLGTWRVWLAFVVGCWFGGGFCLCVVCA